MQQPWCPNLQAIIARGWVRGRTRQYLGTTQISSFQLSAWASQPFNQLELSFWRRSMYCRICVSHALGCHRPPPESKSIDISNQTTRKWYYLCPYLFSSKPSFRITVSFVRSMHYKRARIGMPRNPWQITSKMPPSTPRNRALFEMRFVAYLSVSYCNVHYSRFSITDYLSRVVKSRSPVR